MRYDNKQLNDSIMKSSIDMAHKNSLASVKGRKYHDSDSRHYRIGVIGVVCRIMSIDSRGRQSAGGLSRSNNVSIRNKALSLFNGVSRGFFFFFLFFIQRQLTKLIDTCATELDTGQPSHVPLLPGFVK